MEITQQALFAGLSFAEMPVDSFHLGSGIYIRKTYAHIFAPYMIAFKPAGKYGHNEGPWKTAKGGFSFNILTEIELPPVMEVNKSFDQKKAAWLITALLRIAAHPYLILCVTSDISFNNVLNSEIEPTIDPIEIKRRVFFPDESGKGMIDEETLIWVKNNWQKVLKMMDANPVFYTAFQAFDTAATEGKASSSLIMIWGAIEQLFSTNTGELKYRVCLNLSTFLYPEGKKRLEAFKKLSKLYNERSTAAHTSKKIESSPLVNSYIFLRNALIKIIEIGEVPSPAYLENLVFGIH